MQPSFFTFALIRRASSLSVFRLNSTAVPFLATAVSAGIATLIMGLVANYPIALASGMGLNALMTFTVCLQMGYSYQECLCLVFVSGLIFVLISFS